jgi:hypothetical protein
MVKKFETGVSNFLLKVDRSTVGEFSNGHILSISNIDKNKINVMYHSDILKKYS